MKIICYLSQNFLVYVLLEHNKQENENNVLLITKFKVVINLLLIIVQKHIPNDVIFMRWTKKKKLF